MSTSLDSKHTSGDVTRLTCGGLALMPAIAEGNGGGKAVAQALTFACEVIGLF